MTRILPDGPQIDIHRVLLARPDDYDGWREAARGLVAAGIPPQAVTFEIAGEDVGLFGEDAPLPEGSREIRVPKAFPGLARRVALHSDPERYALLYAMLWKLQSNREALSDRADPLVDRLNRLAKEVGRDAHKMHAFVRFREMEDSDGEERMVAWFEPDHHITRAEAGFFIRRFPNMRWSILTPEVCIHWDGEALSESPGATKADAPDGDPVEATWKTYYKSIFNPARVKVKAMTTEMPRKYWKNMPETALIPELLAGAQKRESQMIETSMTKRETVPATPKARPSNVEAAWALLRDEASACTRCDLHCNATQTVFGEGPLDPQLMLVGEQPGDAEDLAGKPFVGPAGQLLDAALAEAGVDRSRAYVTNAVKHFKFVARGKRRIHQSPNAGEISACNWWLRQERELIVPPVTVALGASAGRALFGKPVTIGKLRDSPQQLPDGSTAFLTVHPSYLLRLPDRVRAQEERARFVEDLKRARQFAEAMSG
ncbi:UdgX family uracil-DNA binding protein [Sphingomicrobium astaxanthinifaciens]|nr:UdgX family uracil-DNA binding protein [Sphingomicrobium astaxanthinifaciens]MCJ7421518.1 UdgX family uracil-DNA binding protein [Sphingomicrobium astaxanthinifaciens]